MPRTLKAENVDELMERASEALAQTAYFEAEEAALAALQFARAAEDFDRMARICLPLQEARRQRLQLALDAAEADGIRTLVAVDLEARLAPGCVLLGPPLVGDARRLRLAALEQRVPLAVVCREPRTQLGLWPVVAIGQTTVRTRIEAPDDPEHPSVDWLVDAMEQLGDAGIESVDTGLENNRQVDALIARLDAVPDHEKLHQALATACRAAAADRARGDGPKRRSGAPQADAAADEPANGEA